jgi:hypothetical protein
VAELAAELERHGASALREEARGAALLEEAARAASVTVVATARPAADDASELAEALEVMDVPSVSFPATLWTARRLAGAGVRAVAAATGADDLLGGARRGPAPARAARLLGGLLPPGARVARAWCAGRGLFTGAETSALLADVGATSDLDAEEELALRARADDPAALALSTVLPDGPLRDAFVAGAAAGVAWHHPFLGRGALGAVLGLSPGRRPGLLSPAVPRAGATSVASPPRAVAVQMIDHLRRWSRA